jgi:hypothetical protein
MAETTTFEDKKENTINILHVDDEESFLEVTKKFFSKY